MCIDLDDMMQKDEWWESETKKICPSLQFPNITLLGKSLLDPKTTLLNCLSLASLWLLTHGFACWRTSQWIDSFLNFYLNLYFQLILVLHAKEPLLWAACFLNFYLDLLWLLTYGLACWRAIIFGLFYELVSWLSDLTSTFNWFFILSCFGSFFSFDFALTFAYPTIVKLSQCSLRAPWREVTKILKKYLMESPSTFI